MSSHTLSIDDKATAQKFNRRSRQIFWRNIVPQTHPLWQMDDDAILDWTLDFEEKHGLLCDGRFGPSCLIALTALSLGGLGGFIIDGREISVPGTIVARMFTPNVDAASVKPDLCCVLAMTELDLAVRERVNGRKPVRAHFSIDSAEGANGESLIIQWADPMRAVPFCPVPKTAEYPQNRQCVGIEIETVLNLCMLDSDERRWIRRRDLVVSDINGQSVRQSILYDEQIAALRKVMQVLEEYAGILHAFPVRGHAYDTDIVENLDGFCGYVGRFNYMNAMHEPGAGFVARLNDLFGALETPKPEVHETPAVAKDTPAEPPRDDSFVLSKYDAQKEELAKKTSPTASFLPTHEDTPRFNLANAIAAAYSSGKAARAGRIADRVKKFDE